MEKTIYKKPAIFSKISKNCIIELALEISICFSFIFGIGDFELISSELQQKPFVGKAFKVTMPRHFAL